MKQLEKALLISSSSQLRNWKKEFTRIHFGQEFCDRLLPSKSEFLKAKKFCHSKKIAFSFTTPFLTDLGLKKALSLAKLLSQEDELVVNDYGLLNAAQHLNVHLAAGRLLNRQYRDPRIASFKGKVPKPFYQHLRQSHASSRQFQKFLLQQGVERVELDNLLQGIATNLSKTKLSASLHTPFAFISTSRLCLTANCTSLSSYNRIGVFPCGKECRKYSFTLRSPLFPTPLILFGNTVLFKNKSLPKEKELLRKGINRVVENSALH